MRWNEDEGTDEGKREMSCDDRGEGRLAGGLVLMTLGTVFLLSRLDVLPSHALSTYWPLILIALGVGRLVGSVRRRRSGSGPWLIFIGLWAEANVQHWFGLDWHNSWPVFLIFGGLCVLVSELTGEREARNAR